MKLSLSELAVERGEKTLFAPLTIHAESGTLVFVSGANGAGKTSLLRVLAGLGSASTGSVSWYNTHGEMSASNAATFVGHANAMNDALTVAENLSYAASLSGLNGSEVYIRAALDAFRVAKLMRRRASTLSQGQRKRAALARLLLSEAPGSRAWLLDEPFVALDVDTQHLLETLIAAELRAGAIVVLTSHQAFDIDAPQRLEVAL